MYKYVNEYVYCLSCRSNNTTLTKDSVSRIYFKRCNDCMCVKSVSTIKQGYHAQMRVDRVNARKNE